MEKLLAAARPASAGRASTPIWCRRISARGRFSARSSRRSPCRGRSPQSDHCGFVPGLSRQLSRPRPSPAPYRLDARRCISYLTIENKDRSRTNSARLIGNRIYMAATTAWRSAPGTSSPRRRGARPVRGAGRVDGRAIAAGSWPEPRRRRVSRPLHQIAAVKRIGRDCFVRNVLIAIGNADDPALAHDAKNLLTDDMARWCARAAVRALALLLPADELSKLAASAHDPDESVQREWALAVGGA